MEIVVLVPARSGSKRIPGKNMRDLGGWPLMRYSVQTGLDCGWPVWVSTDREYWGRLAEGWGARVILRPAELAGDDIGDGPVIAHALREMGGADLVVYLRPTTPFRLASRVVEAERVMREALPHATSLRSIEEMAESAYKCFGAGAPWLEPLVGTMAEANRPNQQLPATYRGNGYVDIVRADRIRAGEDPWGDRVIGYMTPRVIEIDTEDDLRYAAWYASRHTWREEVVIR